MILEPSIDVLQERIKSKYTLVTLSAKRARQLLHTNSPLIENPKSNKLVGVALEEIKSGEVYVKQD